jgi:hypothetical protein
MALAIDIEVWNEELNLNFSIVDYRICLSPFRA